MVSAFYLSTNEKSPIRSDGKSTHKGVCPFKTWEIIKKVKEFGLSL
jgi:hypothetical protein